MITGIPQKKEKEEEKKEKQLFHLNTHDQRMF